VIAAFVIVRAFLRFIAFLARLVVQSAFVVFARSLLAETVQNFALFTLVARIRIARAGAGASAGQIRCILFANWFTHTDRTALAFRAVQSRTLIFAIDLGQRFLVQPDTRVVQTSTDRIALTDHIVIVILAKDRTLHALARIFHVAVLVLIVFVISIAISNVRHAHWTAQLVDLARSALRATNRLARR